MLNLVEINDKKLKGTICESTLHALPNWFGIEEAIIYYSTITKEMPFYTVYDNSLPVGFVAIKVHNSYTSEVCVMGVLQEYHRKGIGRMLIQKCEEFCRENGMEFLTVKTLDGSSPDKNYEKTRLFYSAMGFRPLEVFKTFWNEENPCLFLAKFISK